jgi:mannose/fructose/N-acetylgalactosamine-specific phosphotransferase system component IID
MKILLKYDGFLRGILGVSPAIKWPAWYIRNIVENSWSKQKIIAVVFLYTVKPVLRGHHWDKEKVAW